MTWPGRTVALIGGTGHMGIGLARRLAQAGMDVIIGSRDGTKARAVASSLGFASLRGRHNPEAAGTAEVIVLTVPYAAHRSTLLAIAGDTDGKVVVDTTVPLVRNSSLHVIRPPARSAAEEARELLPRARIVSGFHTVSADLLADLTRTLHGDVLLCGDDAGAKEIAAELVRAIRMRPVDVGALSQAHALEQLAGLLLALNRRHRRRDLGVQISGLD